MSWLDEVRADPDRALQRARQRLFGVRRILLGFATVFGRRDATLLVVVSADCDVVAVPRWREWASAVSRVRFIFPSSTVEREVGQVVVRDSGVALFWLRDGEVEQ